MAPNIKAIQQRHEALKRRKQAWLPLYDVLSRFCLLRKRFDTVENSEGPFLFNQVHDSTAIHAASMMASSLLGQIWPDPFSSFEFVPQVAQDEAIFSDAYEMMNDVNQVLPAALSNPLAGVMTSFWEIFIDLIIFGTACGVLIETKEYANPVVFRAIDAKFIAFDENEYGMVDTVYVEKAFTVAQLVAKFKLENVSERVRKLYEQRKLDEMVKCTHLVEPRRERNPLLLGSQNMKFASLWYESEDEHVLEESGFNENPYIVVRLWKNPGELQGRSPAMSALSDIRAVNKLVEMSEKAGEFALHPVKVWSTEDVLGGGKLPWFPGASIAVHDSGRLGTHGRPPVEILNQTQNPGWAIQRIEELRASIMKYFMNDVLTDLSNTSRQTLGEANIRNELRQFIVGPMLIRVLLELIGPFLDRAFNIMLEMGFFGVIRGSIQELEMLMQGFQPKYISEDFIDKRMNGFKGYRINYISPAARLMNLEQALGLERFTAFSLNLAQVLPGSTAVLKGDEMVRNAQKLFGASQKVLFSPAEVEQTRQAQAQQQAAMNEQQAAQVAAMTLKDAGAGVKNIAAAAK